MTAKLIPHLSEQMLLDMSIGSQDVIRILEHVIRSSKMNLVWAAPKAVINPGDGRYIMATLAAMSDPPLVATKSLVLNARNSEVGLPQINSLVTLLHGETGLPLATIDGNWVTAVRTAGLSAVAAKYMASPVAKSVGFIGCGVQARSHLKIFSDMFPLENVKVFGRGAKNIDSLCEFAHKLGLTTKICKSPQDAVEDVNLVVSSVTHTSVKEPFLDANWLSKGTFTAIADLAVPWRKESFSAFDCLVIDDLVQEVSLSNKLVDSKYICDDLSGLILGNTQGRRDEGERTAFVFRGHALGDLALAALALQTYTQGVG